MGRIIAYEILYRGGGAMVTVGVCITVLAVERRCFLCVFT